MSCSAQLAINETTTALAAAIVAADEEPVLSTDRDAAQLELGRVVVEAHLLIEETSQRRPLVVDVVAGFDDRRVTAAVLALVLDPLLELLENRDGGFSSTSNVDRSVDDAHCERRRAGR